MKEQLSNTVQEVLDGNYNPLEAYIFLNEINKFSKTCLEEIKDLAIEEAEKEKGNIVNGYEIGIRHGYNSYDYSVNEEYRRLKNELKELEDKLKIASKKELTFMDEETGEVFEPCPIKSGVSDSITLKFKK